jgi:hypothetical protein
VTISTRSATRYVTPLREGGSLPAVVEGDDQGLYVLKFRGAGQGPKVLVAELIAGELARAAGLSVPEIVFMELDPVLARTEPDPEIQALIRASGGLNLALDFLPGSVMFDPVVEHPEALLASQILWLDAYVSNVDRTARNANMLMWHGRLWLIDHGAALYFQHAWDGDTGRAVDPFTRIKDHILLPFAGRLPEADQIMSARITADLIRDITALVPEAWLDGAPAGAYAEYLIRRLAAPRRFVEEAMHARAQLV